MPTATADVAPPSRRPGAVAGPGAGENWSGGWKGRDRRSCFSTAGPDSPYGYLDPLAAEPRRRPTGSPRSSNGAWPRRPSKDRSPSDQAVADVSAVLDALGWDRAFVVGHSWGGHLLFHLAPARVPGRLPRCPGRRPPRRAWLTGGWPPWRELAWRPPARGRPESGHWVGHGRAAAGAAGTDEEFVDGLRLFVAGLRRRSVVDAPALPATSRTSVAAFAGLFGWPSMWPDCPGRRRACRHGRSPPLGLVAGARSPVPVDQAAAATAAVIRGAWLEVMAGAGHLPWYERPGSVRAALDRLVAESEPSGGVGDDR